MKHQRGLSLIELIIFIVVVGIMATGSLLTFKNVLNHNTDPAQDFQAAQLANARMNMLVLTRLMNGMNGLTDPCASGSPPAACTALSTYATSANLTVASSLSAATDILTATITVTGDGQATNRVRFVQ